MLQGKVVVLNHIWFGYTHSMGEVIHGDYSRWANDGTLHSVTNYMLHKALYSAHNDHNYFEVAHTIKYVNNMVGNRLNLYTFVDNHDVERIYTKLNNKSHFVPVQIMLYTLPGIPSIYYGSEFGIEGKKEHGSDDSLRPQLNFEDYENAVQTNSCTKLIAALGKIRQETPALYCGDYNELVLQNTVFAYERRFEEKSVIITVNNGDNEATLNLHCSNASYYVGALTGEKVSVCDGQIQVRVPANSGEIWIPDDSSDKSLAPIKTTEFFKSEKAVEMPITMEPVKTEETVKVAVEKPTDEADECKESLDLNKPYEEMSVAELQEAILEKMRKNGPVTDYMLGTVRENTHLGSLINWVKSFN